jgi:hypothetical protein
MGTGTRDWQADGGQLRPSVPRWIAERGFRRGDAPEIRRFARAFGSRSGLRDGQLPDFVLAVNEAAGCAIAQWPGAVRVRLWSAGARVYCEVRCDALVRRGTGTGTGAGRGLPPGGDRGKGKRQGEVRGEEDALRRRVLRQVCDYVCFASEPDATRVLLTMTVRRAARDPSGRAGTRRPR